MNFRRYLAVLGAVAATVSTVNAAIANAYDTIDYGTDKAACQAAEKQLQAAGIRYNLLRNWARALLPRLGRLTHR